MTEGEFRDWLRGELRSLSDRLKAVEGRAHGVARVEVSEHIRGEVRFLAETLVRKVKDGSVAALAVAFVTPEGLPMSGFAADGFYLTLAGAAAFVGLECLEGLRKQEARAEEAADGQPA